MQAEGQAQVRTVKQIWPTEKYSGRMVYEFQYGDVDAFLQVGKKPSPVIERIPFKFGTKESWLATTIVMSDTNNWELNVQRADYNSDKFKAQPINFKGALRTPSGKTLGNFSSVLEYRYDYDYKTYYCSTGIKHAFSKNMNDTIMLDYVVTLFSNAQQIKPPPPAAAIQTNSNLSQTANARDNFIGLGLLKDDTFTDAKIVCADGKDSIPVHKAVLANRSEYFRAMFTNGMKEANTNVIEIKDFDKDTIQAIVSYLYTGTLAKKEQATMDLFAASDVYGVTLLKDHVEQLLKGTVTMENCFTLLTFADKHDAKELKRATINFMVKNFAEIQKLKKEWEDLCATNHNLVLDIMAQAIKKV